MQNQHVVDGKWYVKDLPSLVLKRISSTQSIFQLILGVIVSGIVVGISRLHCDFLFAVHFGIWNDNGISWDSLLV